MNVLYIMANQILNKIIKTSKKGNRYIGNMTDLDVKWECRSCKEFKFVKDIVCGTGDISCKECLMNDKYLKVVK